MPWNQCSTCSGIRSERARPWPPELEAQPGRSAADLCEPPPDPRQPGEAAATPARREGGAGVCPLACDRRAASRPHTGPGGDSKTGADPRGGLQPRPSHAQAVRGWNPPCVTGPRYRTSCARNSGYNPRLALFPPYSAPFHLPWAEYRLFRPQDRLVAQEHRARTSVFSPSHHPLGTHFFHGLIGPDPDDRRPRTGHRGGPRDADGPRSGHLGDRAPGDRGEAVRGAAGRRAGRPAMEGGRSAGREAVGRVKEFYDRVRIAVDDGLAGVVRAVRADAAAARRAAERASDALGPELQDARRDVARALDMMRQHDRERDHGPSR